MSNSVVAQPTEIALERSFSFEFHKQESFKMRQHADLQRFALSCCGPNILSKIGPQRERMSTVAGDENDCCLSLKS